MDSLFGAEGSLIVRFVVAFVIVLALIGLTFWLIRRFGTARVGTAAQRGRQPRLAVIDAAPVDGTRRPQSRALHLMRHSTTWRNDSKPPCAAPDHPKRDRRRNRPSHRMNSPAARRRLQRRRTIRPPHALQTRRAASRSPCSTASKRK